LKSLRRRNREGMSQTLNERQLYRAAMAALARARVTLLFMSFERIRKSLERVRCEDVGPFAEAERVCRAVEMASQKLPFTGNCLVKATAGMLLLRRMRLPGELRIGVAREDRRGFEAHAWIECEGRALIGAEERERFTPLSLNAQDPASLG